MATKIALLHVNTWYHRTRCIIEPDYAYLK